MTSGGGEGRTNWESVTSDGHGHHRRLQSVDFLESVVGCEFFWQNGKTPLSPSFITVYYVN